MALDEDVLKVAPAKEQVKATVGLGFIGFRGLGFRATVKVLSAGLRSLAAYGIYRVWGFEVS